MRRLDKVSRQLIAYALIVLVFCGCGHSKKEKKASPYPLDNKSFVVVIASYNNEKVCERNLRSLLDQSYSQYRAIYIDDASTDSTYEKVTRFLEREDPQKRVTVVRNHKNQGAMANFYHAIHSCADHEIIVVLDGDDWLAHEDVLSELNRTYANPNVWITYGSYVYYPSYRKGECLTKIPRKIRESGQLRSFLQKGFALSHLRTFYAGLFKKIKLQDTLYEGKFMGSSWDAASMIPMMEMAGKHYRFVRSILYINNRANPLNDDKVAGEEQQTIWRYVLSLPPYQPLAASPLMAQDNNKADLMVFSSDHPMQLYAFLESLQKFVGNLGQVFVIYHANGREYGEAYEELMTSFPSVKFIRQSNIAEFKSLVIDTVKSGPSDFIFFALDEMIVKDFVDLKECTAALRDSGAYGFYLRLGNNLDYCYLLQQPQRSPKFVEWKKNIYAWQFQEGFSEGVRGDWIAANVLDMTVFSKDEICAELAALDFQNPVSLETAWLQKMFFKESRNERLRKVGLFFADTKVVNLPSSHELISQFKEGLKIDISPYFQRQNHSIVSDLEPTFIEREAKR